jgi:hypothetical protein
MMSRHNKANKNNYSQAGRLEPDEMARQRVSQDQLTERSKQKEKVIGKGRFGGQEPSRPRSAPEE